MSPGGDNWKGSSSFRCGAVVEISKGKTQTFPVCPVICFGIDKLNMTNKSTQKFALVYNTEVWIVCSGSIEHIETLF